MWWLVSALGVSGGVAALLGLWRVSVWKARAESAAHARDAARGELALQAKATAQLSANFLDQLARVEAVVAWYKVQLRLVQKDLDACDVPGAVRDSLRGMLSGPPRPGKAPAPGGGVPGKPGPTTPGKP